MLVALVDVGIERGHEAVQDGPPGSGNEEIGPALTPLADRLRVAAEIAPAPPAQWVRDATEHFVDACLKLPSKRPDDPLAAAEELFRQRG